MRGKERNGRSGGRRRKEGKEKRKREKEGGGERGRIMEGMVAATAVVSGVNY